MYEPLRCIALRKVRYNDRHDILTVYTREHGRLSLLTPAGNGRTASRIKAITQPMGMFDCVADMRPGREIISIRDVSARLLPAAVSPLKATVALFVADTLAALLRETQPDRNLFDFVELSARTLEQAPAAAIANFHICFLMRLQHFMGVEPDWSTYLPESVLDFADGIFRTTPPLHGRYISPAESSYALTLGRINFRNMGRFRLGRADRNRILDRIIAYYNTHFQGLASLNSLAILRSMFD
ncbi:MAG: DNA repair protein RecO C-terminal domain-containing protein [Muribaculaceae bacterium]|nr:DNA repair protein RecO C-terminal domain-containing protein [Muribaculaceae bacterium]